MPNFQSEQIFQLLLAAGDFFTSAVGRQPGQEWMRQAVGADFMSSREPFADLLGAHEPFCCFANVPFIAPANLVRHDELNGLEAKSPQRLQAMFEHVLKPIIECDHDRRPPLPNPLLRWG